MAMRNVLFYEALVNDTQKKKTLLAVQVLGYLQTVVDSSSS